MAKQLKLKEIADRISAHLRRFEADPVINRHRKYDKRLGEWVDCDKSEGHGSYYHAHASVRGAYVGVSYVSYQHTSTLKRAEAMRYLNWLDAGNVGQHHRMNRDLGLDNVAKRIALEEAEKEDQ